MGCPHSLPGSDGAPRSHDALSNVGWAELHRPDAEALAFDEAFERDGTIRPLYDAIVSRFSGMDAAELRRRERIIEEEFRR